jgi:hypothetical protein
MWERDCGRGRGTKKTKAIRYGACYYSIVFTRIGCTLLTCDMYMSDLRHIHDPVFSSLKMEGIRLLSFFFFSSRCPGNIDRDSSVDKATCYGLDGPGIESQRGQDFPHMSRPALRPTQPPIQWVPRLSRG